MKSEILLLIYTLIQRSLNLQMIECRIVQKNWRKVDVEGVFNRHLKIYLVLFFRRWQTFDFLFRSHSPNYWIFKDKDLWFCIRRCDSRRNHFLYLSLVVSCWYSVNVNEKRLFADQLGKCKTCT